MRKNIFNKPLLVFTLNNSYYAISACDIESTANQYRIIGTRRPFKAIKGYLSIRNLFIPVMYWSTINIFRNLDLYNMPNNYLILRYNVDNQIVRVALPIAENLGIINSDEYISLSPSLVMMDDLKISIVNTYVEKENHRSVLENLNTAANMFLV